MNINNKLLKCFINLSIPDLYFMLALYKHTHNIGVLSLWNKIHSLIRSIKHSATKISTSSSSDLSVLLKHPKFLQMFFKCFHEKDSLPHHLSTWQPFKYLKMVIIFPQSFFFQTAHTIFSKVQNCHPRRCLWHISNLENTTGNRIAGSTELSKHKILCRGLCKFVMRCVFWIVQEKIHIFTSI